jgi:hypothetical protein
MFVGLAIMMKHWIADVVACSDGADVSRDGQLKLTERGIPLRPELIKAMAGTKG